MTFRYNIRMASEARLRIQPSLMPAAVASLIRDVRRTIGWTQEELARRAATSQTKIWRMEAGEPGALDLATLDRVLAALGLRCTLEVEGRHLTERRGQRDLVHARLVSSLAGRLERAGWSVETEIPIDEAAPRGWIDLLGWRSVDAGLVLVEAKTDIPDVGGLQRQVGWYAAQAARVASRFGWRPHSVTVAVVCLDTTVVAGRLAIHRDLLRRTFPGDPRDLDRWLRDPAAGQPSTWTLAVTDLAARRTTALRRCGLVGRAAAPAYRDYAEVARRLNGAVPSRRGPGG